MGFYLKRVAAKDTPADVAWRVAHAKAVKQANEEAFNRFKVLTAEVLPEFEVFRECRVKELTEEFLK